MVLAAVCQITSTRAIPQNLALCQGIIRQAAAQGAKCIFLPEASDFIASSPEESHSLTYSDDARDFVHGIQQVAREAGVQVNVGIHAPCPHDQAKIINQALFIGSDGAVSARYDKAHLFDVAIENGPILMESRSTARGDQIGTPVSTSIGQLGMLICFDLRFPEISLGLRHRGAQLLAYPSAFTERTGAAHWHVLLRARAIETQCYVIAAAQVGAHNEKRRSYGHACVIDPWGSIVAQMPDVMDKNGFCLFDVDLEIVGTVRKHMPLQRRTDLYPAFT